MTRLSLVRIIPWAVHEVVEYLVGLFLVLAPFIFGLRDEPAFPVFMAAGVVVLAVALLTRGPGGILEVLPEKAHAIFDYVLAFVLLLAPFVFGFSGVSSALYISVLLGVGQLVMTLITAFPVSGEPQIS